MASWRRQSDASSIGQLISASATQSSNGSSLPLATGIPLFGDFCNGDVKYEKCYWHMALEIDYWLHTTLTIPVKTVSINVTLVSTSIQIPLPEISPVAMPELH